MSSNTQTAPAHVISALESRRSTTWIGVAAALFCADLLLHLPITDFCDMLAKRFGFFEYDAAVKWAFVAIACAMLLWVWLRRNQTGIRIPVVATVLVAAAACVQRVLLVAAAENAHYPQYALLVWVLARALPGVEGAWVGAATLGFVDEVYQYLVLPRGTPMYLDWNDVFLNAMGAAFGVVFLLALRTPRAERPLLSTRTARMLVIAVVAWATVAAPPVLIPFFSVTPGGRPFHRLAMSESVILIALLWRGIRYVVPAPSNS